MSKRKSEDERSVSNLWEKFKIDSKGYLFDVHIRQHKHEEGEEDSKSEKSKSQNFGVYQGSRIEQSIFIPTPNEEPIPGINGFRCISFHGMRDWENGIHNSIINFISNLCSLKNEVIQSYEEGDKLSLSIFLPFAFKGNQESNFNKSLSTLLSIPNIKKSVGSFSYSEGGCLNKFLTQFPILQPNPELFYRYDAFVYCENTTLVEDYFSDLEHWLSLQWVKQPSKDNLNIVRQARLKFFVDREDTAQQMLALLKEKFETSISPCTFTIRFDCPGFSLEPFNVENTNTGEFMALELKNEYPLKEDKDIDEFDDELGVEPLTKKKPPGDKDNNKDGRNGSNKKQKEGDSNDSNNSSTSILIWKSYKLVRASDANILGNLMNGHLPLLKSKLILN